MQHQHFSQRSQANAFIWGMMVRSYTVLNKYASKYAREKWEYFMKDNFVTH